MEDGIKIEGTAQLCTRHHSRTMNPSTAASSLSSHGRRNPTVANGQHAGLKLSLVCLLLLVSRSAVQAQRFMRQGFSNQEDFGAEMKLDEGETGAVDMTREMFLMQDMPWQLQPVDENYSGVRDRAVRRHLQKHMGTNRPVELKLLKKRGKFGLRAVGKTLAGKKLRAFWRQAAAPPRGSVDFLKAPYDEACRSRLFTVEFEVQLPPLHKSSKDTLPSVVYQLSVEPGSMNAKALVPRTAGRVVVYPAGRGGECVEVGTAKVSVAPMRAGLVDPGWAKGRPNFRRGRNSGLM